MITLGDLQKTINDLIEKCPKASEARVMIEERDGVLSDIFDVGESADYYKCNRRIEFFFYIYSEHTDMTENRIKDIEKNIACNKVVFKELKDYESAKDVPTQNWERIYNFVPKNC